jgi:hypothetical protein
MAYKLGNITNFLESHGWQKLRQTKLFDIYEPPNRLELPQEFYLEVPNTQQDRGFKKYMDGIVEILDDVYGEKYTVEDFKTFFASDNSIFSLQIIDPDTKFGTIRLERLKNAFNQVFRSIKQAVVFSVSNQPIFGNAKYEVSQYINFCRGRQTEFGSYIVKFELPENHLTLLGERSIPNMLFDSIEFLTFISADYDLKEIDKGFVEQYKEYINIELFEAIIKLYKEAEIQNVYIALDSNKVAKENYYQNIRDQIGKIQLTVKGIKDILLESVPLETRGTIFKLSSKEIESKGRIWIETDIAEERQIIEVQLSSERYKKAVEAHKNGVEVYVKGIAKQMRNKYVIEDLEAFEIK